MGCFDFNHAPQRLILLGLSNMHSARWEGIVASVTHRHVFENVDAIGDNVDIFVYLILSMENLCYLFTVLVL